MTKNELRIGNWVRHTNESGTFNIQIKELREMEAVVSDDSDRGWNFDYDAIEPILLTEKMLLKCGFDRLEPNIGLISQSDIDNGELRTVATYVSKPLTYNISNGWWLYNKHMDIAPKYLHQLQNLYFTITEKELEIQYK